MEIQALSISPWLLLGIVLIVVFRGPMWPFLVGHVWPILRDHLTARLPHHNHTPVKDHRAPQAAASMDAECAGKAEKPRHHQEARIEEDRLAGEPPGPELNRVPEDEEGETDR